MLTPQVINFRSSVGPGNAPLKVTAYTKVKVWNFEREPGRLSNSLPFSIYSAASCLTDKCKTRLTYITICPTKLIIPKGTNQIQIKLK
jgi:hypothetical protein